MNTKNKQDECREALLPCPFCGPDVISLNKPYIMWDSSGHSVCCRNCGTSGPNTDTADEAVAAWNHRQPQAKALTESDCIELAKKLQDISDRIANEEHPEPFQTRAEADAAYEKCKHLEIEAHAQAIHAAIPPDQSAEVERLRGLLVEAVDLFADFSEYTGDGAAPPGVYQKVVKRVSEKSRDFLAKLKAGGLG